MRYTKAMLLSVTFFFMMQGISSATNLNTIQQKWDTLASASTGIQQQIYPGINDIDIYPNPTVRQVTVRLNGKKGHFKIALLNSSGAMVMQPTTTFQQGGGQIYKFNVSSLASGIYYVRIVSEEKQLSKTYKVIKVDR